MLRRNVLLLLLASLWSLTSLAQDAALTPEATPDAQLTTVASAEPTWESASAATATGYRRDRSG